MKKLKLDFLSKTLSIDYFAPETLPYAIAHRRSLHIGKMWWKSGPNCIEAEHGS